MKKITFTMRVETTCKACDGKGSNPPPRCAFCGTPLTENDIKLRNNTTTPWDTPLACGHILICALSDGVCPACQGRGVTVEERNVTEEVNGAMELANVAKLAAVMIGEEA